MKKIKYTIKKVSDTDDLVLPIYLNSSVDEMGPMVGFDGNISNLWYYNYALGTSEIQNLARNGANTKMISSGGMSVKDPNYLSLRWFFFGAGDMFNPNIPQSTQQNS